MRPWEAFADKEHKEEMKDQIAGLHMEIQELQGQILAMSTKALPILSKPDSVVDQAAEEEENAVRKLFKHDEPDQGNEGKSVTEDKSAAEEKTETKEKSVTEETVQGMPMET